jgi:hypothetical protein
MIQSTQILQSGAEMTLLEGGLKQNHFCREESWKILVTTTKLSLIEVVKAIRRY